MSINNEGAPFNCGERWASIDLSIHPGLDEAITRKLGELAGSGQGIYDRDDAMHLVIEEAFSKEGQQRDVA